MTRILYLDCFSGASGDMLLGAFLDAGLPLEALRDALGTLGLEHYTLKTARVLRAGVSATQFTLEEQGGVARHHEHHEHHEHPEHHGHHGHHHSVSEIEALIAGSGLRPEARERAVGLFRRLASVEAEIHQMPLERIHLHEVGALDSIIDIVGCVFAFEWFNAARIVASPLNLGRGMVRCAHGVFPVPAPATARLLEGVPVYQDGPAVELTTPTGALLVSGYASSVGPMPAMTTTRIGYGAGGHDFPDRPNVLRVFVGEESASVPTERVSVMAFEIDDMNPQLYGVLMDQLFEAGAHDVFYTPVQMKKNRPGTLVTVISPPAQRASLAALVFRETTTLGVRYHDMARECLAREVVAVTTVWGTLPVKVGRLDGVVVNAAPEFEACVHLARSHGVAVKEVQAAAMKAWLEL